MIRLAYFISPHGFGHAARAAAVMAALHAHNPAFHFEIFTRVPRWFFAESVRGAFTYHAWLTDVGLVQDSALRENIPQTLTQLAEFFPFAAAPVAALAARVARLKCRAVLCDIAPLGIAVARQAGVPSVLIENFMWDWIYGGYARAEARFQPHIAFLRGVFRSADWHIQTEPVCRRTCADLVVPPVAREPRTPAKTIRAELGIPRGAKVVLITMGGIPQQHAFLEQLTQVPRVHFILPGNGAREEKRDNVIGLPHRSRFYHPDLLNASDAVIGKAGYSTVAEAYRAGIPFGYIARAKFRESKPLGDFIETEMRGREISARAFETGKWLAALPALLELPRVARTVPNGAAQIARWFVAG